MKIFRTLLPVFCAMMIHDGCADWKIDGKIHYEVMVCENAVGLAVKKSADLCEQVRATSLTASLRKQVKIQIHALDDLYTSVRDLMQRGEETYYSDLCARLQKLCSLSGDGLCEPTKVYEYLGFDPKKAMTMPYDRIKKYIDAALKDKSITKERKKTLQQMRVIFANMFAKQEYDAYLQGQRFVEALQISIIEKIRLSELADLLEKHKAQLETIIEKTDEQIAVAVEAVAQKTELEAVQAIAALSQGAQAEILSAQ